MDDTRDIAIEVRTDLRALKRQVDDNSGMIRTLYDAEIKRQGRNGFIGAGIAMAKGVPYGAIGAGIFWLLQHSPIR